MLSYPLDELYRIVADALAATVPDSPDATAPATAAHAGALSPGDDFAARTDWPQILCPHGWALAYTVGATGYWRRPGKDGHGISATTNALGTDRLRVFSTSTDFECKSYGKLGALAVLEHRGDLSAAAKALRAQGFGAPRESSAEMIAGIIGPPRTPTMDPPGELTAEDLAAQRYAAELAAEVRRQQVTREARRLVDAAERAATWREPASRATLVEELAIVDEATAYRVERLLPAGGNVLLAAQFKAGKTTLCNNLLCALADGEPFLGRFAVEPPQGRVAIFNYEVGDRQYRAWLRELGVRNADRVCVLNLRGHRLSVIDAQIEDWIVNWLIAHEVSVWIVDPFARAFTGCGDENSNSEVGVFLDTLDVIKARAGVGELVLPTHTGRAEQEMGQERARGATRLDDWADARWLLTVDEQQRRYLRATGRDVDVDEEMLSCDPVTRRLALGGWDRRGMRDRDLAEELARFVAANPGLGVNEIVSGQTHGRNRVIAALQVAISRQQIVVSTVDRRKRLHYPPGASPSMSEVDS